MDLPTIRACLFDLDGLLINSEDLIWKCINDVLAEYSKPPLSWNVKAQIQGRPLPEASRIILDRFQLPLSSEEYQNKLGVLHAEYFPTAKLLPGVEELLWNLVNASNIEMALATSSDREKFQLKTNHLQEISSTFPCRILGDDPRIQPGRGKPAPDIYLQALETLNAERRRQGFEKSIKPAECLVFEDSVLGVQSGRSAGMQVVWVPHPGLLEYAGNISRLPNSDPGSLSGDPNSRTNSESSGENQQGAAAIDPTSDHFIRVLSTLEDFDYISYGIELK